MGETKCPKCNSRNYCVYMYPGEQLDPNGDEFGDMAMFLCVDIPDILICEDCLQIFGEDGKLYEENDFKVPSKPKCPHCGHRIDH